MDSKEHSSALERNPKTHAAHKQEVFWQISVPLLLGILGILAALGAIIFSALQPVTEVGRWASVSLIWLILPALFIALIMLALLAGFIFAVIYVARRIPHVALIIQLYINQGRDKIGQVLNMSVEPFLRINSIWAAIRWASERNRVPTQEKNIPPTG